MKIWVDADACPRVVKDLVFKASERLKVEVTLVANSPMGIPRTPLVDLVVVGKSFDEADQYIVDHAGANDLAITADIPLASDLVDKGILAMNPRGSVYTEANVKEVLAMRNLMQELRGTDSTMGGPPPFGPKDKEKFANSFDRELTRLLQNP